MAQQSGSPRFQALFESALEGYEKKAGVTLIEHPLAIQFQSCDSIEDITAILQRQTQAFVNLQGSDRIFKSIKTTVSILTTLSSAASLVDTFSLVHQKVLTQCSTSLTGFFLQTFPPVKAVQACLAILLDVCPSPGSYKDILLTST